MTGASRTDASAPAATKDDQFIPPDRTAPLDRSRLAAYLADAGMRLDLTRPIRQFSGGLANRNYLLWIDGQPVVLRRPPDGDLPPGAHDMAREHRVLSRLHAGLPLAPRGLLYCADRRVIGVPFQLLEYRRGIVFKGSDLGAHDNAAARSALSNMLVRTLASIHAVDLPVLGLGDLGRPDGFLKRGIEAWTARGLRIADAAAARRVRDLGGWLSSRTFRQRVPTLLHCDFKLDNVLVEPESLVPSAILDWDMATRGDPGFDLATLLSYWTEPSDPECLRLLDQMPVAGNGFLTRSEVARLYSSATGVNLDDMHELYVFALLKLGVVFLQLHRQFLAGAVEDPRYERFAGQGEEILDHACDLARGGGCG